MNHLETCVAIIEDIPDKGYKQVRYICDPECNYSRE
jgi:hypothetical protein